MPSIGNATLCVDSRGRAPEREVKLQLLGVTRIVWIGVVERPNAR